MKIALCFLTYDNLTQPKLWNNIFNKNKDKLNVYIHNKNEFVDYEYGLHNFCIKNKVDTRYAHKSLVEATLLLFKEAFLNKENEFFILLSDKCIPLHPFDYIYNKIIEINSNIICNWSPTEFIERFDCLTDNTFFDKNTFSQDSQWVMLNRNTLEFFLNNNFLHLYSDEFHAADEFYFGNLCNKFHIQFFHQAITHFNWLEKSDDENDRPFPKTYTYLTNEMVEQIKQSGCFFVRKISKNCILPSYYDCF